MFTAVRTCAPKAGTRWGPFWGPFSSARNARHGADRYGSASSENSRQEYKLADSGGLYLLVTPSGGRLWRHKFRLHGVEKKLALGRYPDVSLSQARKARDAAREPVSKGIDPAVAKRRNRIVAKFAAGTTFGDVAGEYIDKAEREGRSPATISKLRWVRQLLLPAIGNRPIDQIEPHELLSVLKHQEAAGILETAKRTTCGQHIIAGLTGTSVW